MLAILRERGGEVRVGEDLKKKPDHRNEDEAVGAAADDFAHLVEITETAFPTHIAPLDAFSPCDTPPCTLVVTCNCGRP